MLTSAKAYAALCCPLYAHSRERLTDSYKLTMRLRTGSPSRDG